MLIKKVYCIIAMILFSTYIWAGANEVYLKKFQTYCYWRDNLPTEPTPEFIEFISLNTPLTEKLRQQWLHELGKQKAWVLLEAYYKPSSDNAVNCLAATSLYHQGKKQRAFTKAKKLWLTGHSQPQACNELFKLLLHHDEHHKQLITKRIALALEQRHISLATYLLKQYKNPHYHDIKQLNHIHNKPQHITYLKKESLHGDYYLYGLKRLVKLNIDEAIKYWRHSKTKQLLSEEQQQRFLAHLALYKAVRDNEDTPLWFAKIKPKYLTNVLHNWQIRHAIKHYNWPRVETLIAHMPDKDKPMHRYWLARALEAQGKIKEADNIYKTLAQKRHYYGFLASNRLNEPLHFDDESCETNLAILDVYKPVLQEIQRLYNQHKSIEASKLVNDFSLELPKQQRSALAYWLASNLQWHGKSVYISNVKPLHNQLSLRFPTAYQKPIKRHAKQYNISQPFIYAIIRQESAFREQVVSHAGAYGLMQLMPKTAKNIAKQAKVRYRQRNELFIPEKNIQLGTTYLYLLAQRFNHHPILMAAAYNAGPRQVDTWLKTHDPKDVDIWIDTLPWHETRHYLKNVISFYAVYQYRLDQKPDISFFFQPFLPMNGVSKAQL